MRLIVDECVPRSVAEFLAERGHEIIYVVDALSSGTPDPIIAAFGDRNDAIVVTWNARDFKALTGRIPAGNRRRFRRLGLMLFRCPEPQARRRIEEFIASIEFEHEQCRQRRDCRLFVEIQGNALKIIR